MSNRRLKAKIVENGYTLPEFSEKFNFSYPRLSRLCSGKLKINIDDIKIICEALKVSPHEIFFTEWLQ